MPQPPRTDRLLWALFSLDVRVCYETACKCSDDKTPALTALAQYTPELSNRKELLTWAAGMLGKGGERTDIAEALLGVDKTFGLSKDERWKECAKLSSKHKSGDSFRHGKVRGKSVIDVYLNETVDQLVLLANKHDFRYVVEEITRQGYTQRVGENRAVEATIATVRQLQVTDTIKQALISMIEDQAAEVDYEDYRVALDQSTTRRLGVLQFKKEAP